MVSLPSSFYANVLHHVLQLSTHIIELYFMNHGSVFFTMALLSFVRWIMDGYLGMIRESIQLRRSLIFPKQRKNMNKFLHKKFVINSQFAIQFCFWLEQNKHANAVKFELLCLFKNVNILQKTFEPYMIFLNGYKINGRLYSPGSPIQTLLLR